MQGHSIVALEDLVSEMVKNRKLNQAISEAGRREFRMMCEAKSGMITECQTVVINRWESTSQKCSDCCNSGIAEMVMPQKTSKNLGWS